MPHVTQIRSQVGPPRRAPLGAVSLIVGLLVLVVSSSAFGAPDSFPAMDTEGLARYETRHFEIWAPPEAEASARNLAEFAERPRDTIYHDLALVDEAPIRVVLLEDLNEYFVRRGIRPRAPRWAIGLSMGSEGTVLVKIGQGESGTLVNLRQTFTHELAHMALDRATGVQTEHSHGLERVGAGNTNTPRRVPRWLHEGFAIYQAGEWSLERSAVLIQGGLAGEIIPLTELREGFPASGFSVELAYAESYHFLLHLFEKYGKTQFGNFIQALRDDTFESAFAKTYGVAFVREEASWREDLEVSHTWIPVIFGSSSLWFVAGLFFALAYRRKRRRIKARMDAMDDGVPTVRAPDIPLPGIGLERRHLGIDDEEELANRSQAILALLDNVESASSTSQLMVDPRMLRHSADLNEGDDVPRSDEGHTIH